MDKVSESAFFEQAKEIKELTYEVSSLSVIASKTKPTETLASLSF